MPSVWASLEKVSESGEIPLSAEEADAIIEKEAKARADKKARQRARLLDRSKFQVIEQKEISTGQKKLIFNRVEPPLPEESAPKTKEVKLIQAQRRLSEAEFRHKFSVDSRKEQRTLMLSAIVYDKKLTRLQCYHEGRQYAAWSNINFNYLRGLTEVDTKEANYLFFLGIGNESIKRTKEQIRFAKQHNLQINRESSIPQLPKFTKGRYEYFVVVQDDTVKRPEGAYIPIDALHDYYAEHEKRLKIEYQRNEALNEARERHRARNPEKPDEPIINFWPGRGSIYQEPETR